MLPLQLLPLLLDWIKVEYFLITLIAQAWPGRMWYAKIKILMAAKFWVLLDQMDLSQGLIFHPALQSLALIAWLLKIRF